MNNTALGQNPGAIFFRKVYIFYYAKGGDVHGNINSISRGICDLKWFDGVDR